MQNSPRSRRLFAASPAVIMTALILMAITLSQAACDRRPRPSLVNGGSPAPAVTEYFLDSQPFSPTLPSLFDQGRIVVLPAGQICSPPDNIPAEGYAFSAVDLFGRVYHFDPTARWWLASGQALPAALPVDEWDAAWNPRSGALELLVTAPYAGQTTVQVLRWRGGQWRRVTASGAPAARSGARRLFATKDSRWLLAGGSLKGQALAEGWALPGTAWQAWGTHAAGGGPDLARTGFLTDGPADGTLGLLTWSGELWFWKNGVWAAGGHVKTDGLCLVIFDPKQGRILLVWSRGPGQDQYLWHPFQNIDGDKSATPDLLNQTGLVRINEDDEGVWKGWGRVTQEKDAQGQTHDVLHDGFGGLGEPGIKLNGEYGDQIFRRGQIKMIEMPPLLTTLRPRAATYVPTLGGIVAPSIVGLGINAERQPFFPPEARQANETSATLPTLDVIQQEYRLWIFKEKYIRWLKPPFEIYPAIDYPNSYATAEGGRRCLSWTFPESGMFRYEFYEFHNQKVQWVHSPLLTLRQVPQLAWTPKDQVYVCDPVVWGDPAEVIVIGWCGRLGERVAFDKAPNGLGDEAYTQVPDRGFMARISALNPDQWTVTPLPMPFCQGAQLVAAPAQKSLYLLGGRIAQGEIYKGQPLNFMTSNSYVWHWDGEDWRHIEPTGVPPRMKSTTQMAYDPNSRQLLSLTPRALYGFDTASWHCLWQRDKLKGESWPDEVGLLIHPQSHLVLGCWFMPEPILRVWNSERWINVQVPEGITEEFKAHGDKPLEPGGALPNSSANCLPATQPDAFISLDSGRLIAMRMDARRRRDEDRLLRAHWLSFRPASQRGTIQGRSLLPPDEAARSEDTPLTTRATTRPKTAPIRRMTPPPKPTPTPTVTPTPTATNSPTPAKTPGMTPVAPVGPTPPKN